MNKDIKAIDLEDFEAQAARIRKLVAAALRRDESGRHVPVAESEYGAIRLHSYRYLDSLKRAGKLDGLSDYVRQSSPSRPGPTTSTPADLLRILKVKRGTLALPSGRSRIAAELEFALRHNIRPNFVLGFLYEVGNQEYIIECNRKRRVPPAVKRYAYKRKRKP